MSTQSSVFESLKDASPFFLIAGPCVIESREHCMKMAVAIKEITDRVGVKLVFKASFDKANRTSLTGFRGVGIDVGLAILKEVRDTLGVPILTDVHEAEQCAQVAEVCDVLQIPAFMCRQTDLLIAAAKTGKVVNIKKGQFANPLAMTHAYNKVVSSGNDQVILCDRGNMFGYDDMIVDFRNLVQMRDNTGALVIQDVTHALQQPNRGASTSGLRQLVPTIARCAVATGVDGLFMEVHDNPQTALSDAATQWPLDQFEALLQELVDIAKVTKGKITQYV